MTGTIPDPQKPSNDEHAIVVRFSEQSLTTISTLQRQLSDILGEAIWLTPERALHSTLMEIICDTDYGTTPRQQLFTDWHKRYGRIVAETFADVPSVKVRFNQLVISPKAIIIKSENSDAFNEIRSTLLSNMALPAGTKVPPDITHCTIARFNKILDLEDVAEQTKMLSTDFTEHVESFKLLKNLGPPSFDPKTIATYKLRV